MNCVGLFSLRTSLSLLFLFGRDQRFGGKRVNCGRASGSTIPRSTHQFRQHVVPSGVIPFIQASYSTDPRLLLLRQLGIRQAVSWAGLIRLLPGSSLKGGRSGLRGAITSL